MEHKISEIHEKDLEDFKCNVCNEQISIKNIKNRHFKYKIKLKYLCF